MRSQSRCMKDQETNHRSNPELSESGAGKGTARRVEEELKSQRALLSEREPRTCIPKMLREKRGKEPG